MGYIRGKGSPKATPRGVENAIFSWREIVLCFRATCVFLGGKSYDHRRRFEKEVSLKSLISLFRKTIV